MIPGLRRHRRGNGGGWPEGRRSGENRASAGLIGRIRALECPSVPLGRSDRRPTGGADEREDRVRSDEKAVYPIYTLGIVLKERPLAALAGVARVLPVCCLWCKARAVTQPDSKRRQPD